VSNKGSIVEFMLWIDQQHVDANGSMLNFFFYIDSRFVCRDHWEFVLIEKRRV